MNFNALIAVLVIKQIITQEEGEALVQHLHDKPQSTELRDAIASVGEIIGAPVANVVAAAIGPVGPAQREEELAARSGQPVAPVAPESSQVAANNSANVTPTAENTNPDAPVATDTTTDTTSDTTTASDSTDKPADDTTSDDKNTSNKKSSKK